MGPTLDSLPQEIREQILLHSLPEDPNSFMRELLQPNREAAKQLSYVSPGVAAEMPWVWRTWLQQRLVILAARMRDCDLTLMCRERRMQCRSMLHHLCLVVKEVLVAFEKSKAREDMVSPMEVTVWMCEKAVSRVKILNTRKIYDGFEHAIYQNLALHEVYAVRILSQIQKSKELGWSFPLHLDFQPHFPSETSM